MAKPKTIRIKGEKFTNNPRKITREQAEALKRDLDELGDLSGVVHDLESNQFVGGNQRTDAFDIEACQIEIVQELEEPDRQGTVAHGFIIWQGARYAYRQVRWTPEQCQKANIIANLAGGSWDFDILKTWDAGKLDEWGFGAALKEDWSDGLAGLQSLMKAARQASDEPPYAPEQAINRAEELDKKWQVKPGNLWALGCHRLLCGDCTDRAAVLRLMDGRRARLCFTSPPYTDQRTYKQENFNWLNWTTLANDFSDCVFEVLDDPGSFVVNLGLSYKSGKCDRYWELWLNHCEQKWHPLFGWYIWDKLNGFPGEHHGRLARAHEFLFHFTNGKVTVNKWIETDNRKSSGGFRQTDGRIRKPTSPEKDLQPLKIPDSVIRMTHQNGPLEVGDHPAVFPLEFAEFVLNTWGEPGCIVYDPFVGSGTTILAAENLGRVCCAMEIAPAYCAVALERWQHATGEVPSLIEAL